MKPIAIFRHTLTEGPAYFATYLEQRKIPYEVIRIDAGEPVPMAPNAYSGLCFMGGPMSVNDDLPWVAAELALIRDAVAREVPVIGHCLGGQLMAKALGAAVTRNAVKEIGWGAVEVLDHPDARRWLGADLPSFLSFHWHGETFAIPEGATRILASPWCANQAFVMGKHFGMQCHVEMTPELIASWCASGAAEIAASSSPGVQSPGAIQADMDARTARLHQLADKIYSRWIQGLRK